MTPDYRAMCAELIDLLDCFSSTFNIPIETSVVTRARALLAQPEPEWLADEELLRVAANALGYLSTPPWDFESVPMSADDVLTIARAVLAHWGRPAALAEPVGEAQGPTDEALANFTAWFCRNYPGPDTLIHRPEWHAPKVFRAAADAIARWGRPAAAQMRELEFIRKALEQLDD